jgi:archaemetzincin
MASEPPNQEMRRAAVGDLAGLPAALRRAFAPDLSAFEPIPKPGSHDWLAVHDESGQTFEQFKASRPNRSVQARRTLYLQPLGAFAAERSPSIECLSEFASAFFPLEVKALAPVPLGRAFTTRRNPYTQHALLRTGNVLEFLKGRLPADAFCIPAIIMQDLYPEPSWNFVFGQASLRERVGVYRFARYDIRRSTASRARGARGCFCCAGAVKCWRTRLSHLFGLAHCIHFHCLMNGSNHLAPKRSDPLHLCPVCLRKLHWSVGFDPLERYNSLEWVNRTLGFAEEAEWLSRRVQALRAA